MLDFLGLGKSKESTPEKPKSAVSASDAVAEQQLLDVRHQRITTVLRDVLHKHGIPVGWIAVKDVVASPDGVSASYLVHLTVKEGNENLMRYAPALQQLLGSGLSGLDAVGPRSKYVFYWNYAPEGSFAPITMPAPGFWGAKASGSGAGSSVPPKRFDLPVSEYDHRSSGFAPTQPGEMS